MKDLLIETDNNGWYVNRTKFQSLNWRPFENDRGELEYLAELETYESDKPITLVNKNGKVYYDNEWEDKLEHVYIFEVNVTEIPRNEYRYLGIPNTVR